MDSVEPYKEFIREMTLRIERVVGGFAREMREDRLEFSRRFDALQVEIRVLREEGNAQTQALLRVLARLDGGGSAATT